MSITETILQNDEKAVYRLRSLYRSYGYTPYKMSKFEEYDLYVRNKDFLVSDSVITFTDKSGKLMALKPDVTLSIIKNTRDMPAGVQKLCYNENVYRLSDSSGSYKEIMQTGLECMGQIDIYCLCEVLSLAVQSLGAIADDFVLDVSHDTGFHRKETYNSCKSVHAKGSDYRINPYEASECSTCHTVEQERSNK